MLGKDNLLVELNNYISQCSGLSNPPLQYIEQLQEFKLDIEIANEAELLVLNDAWLEIKPKQNGGNK